MNKKIKNILNKMESFNSNIKYLDNSDFVDNILKHDTHGKPLIIMIMATWCGYCKKMAPVFQEFADMVNGRSAYTAVIVSDGKTEEEQQLSGKIDSIVPDFQGFPTIVKFVDGKYVATYQGERTVGGLMKFL